MAWCFNFIAAMCSITLCDTASWDKFLLIAEITPPLCRDSFGLQGFLRQIHAQLSALRASTRTSFWSGVAIDLGHWLQHVLYAWYKYSCGHVLCGDLLCCDIVMGKFFLRDTVFGTLLPAGGLHCALACRTSRCCVVLREAAAGQQGGYERVT